MLEFRMLGPFEVVQQQRPVGLGGPRQRALLAVLVLHRGEVVSSERLIDQLWGERPPATAAKTLQGYVSHLRKALGNGVLVTHRGGYLLATAPGQVDVERFDGMVGDARHALAVGDAAGARRLLGSAFALLRGEPLADLAYEPFAQAEIARLEEACLGALEDRIECDLMLGHHRALVGELESLVNRHPHRERLLGQLMLTLYRSGRHADALEAYHRSRQALNNELGLRPGPELRALEQRILTQDPALDPATVAGPPSRLSDRSRSARGRTLIAAGGALLLAAGIAAVIVELTRRGGVELRAAPNSVAAIDSRTNRVMAQVAVGTRPGAIAFGAGSLWVANRDDQTISRVDATTLQTLRNIPVGDPPTGIAAARGAVWVVGSSSTESFVSVSRIDPQFDVIDHTVRLGNVVPGTPGAVVARGATVWVAPSSGELTRLDAQTGGVVQRLDPNAAPTGIDLGANAPWVTDNEANNVTRIDPTGVVTSTAVGHGPSGIAVGDGGVWVADTGDDSVVRIDPSTRAVTATIPVGSSPAGVAVGAGSVWVANSGDGTVTRIDPQTAKAVATIAVGGSPQAITVVGDRAWVTVDAQTIPAAKLAAGGGTARLDAPYDTSSLDPAQANDPLAAQLLYATCAKLLNYPDTAGPGGSQLVPEVAQSLPRRSADGKSYTFTIRKGFRFSPPSTEPVTAQTFKYSIERSLNPRMKSPVANDFRDITGAQAYMAGKATHLGGVIARGNTLTIRLTAPSDDLPARTTEPAFCAVPTDTPTDPNRVRVIPSAGPYRVAAYTPGQGVVLTRNPNYHGDRPHRLARIELSVGIPARRAIAEVQAGRADYAINSVFERSAATALVARYGPGNRAAKRGRQQFFINPGPQLDFLALNTHRPLFADVRLRQAVSYAIDRAALARLGDYFQPLPEHATDHYLPPGIPGHTDLHVYPVTPNVVTARQLARRHAGATAILYTCNVSPCPEQAQIIKTNLAAIGLRVEVKTFPSGKLFTKLGTPGEPFDMGWDGWIPPYRDPQAMLNPLLGEGTVVPTFEDPAWRARLAAAAQLTGAERYLTYARLDATLARDAAPLVAFGNLSSYDFFSARMGCQAFGFYGMDLAALCVKKKPS